MASLSATLSNLANIIEASQSCVNRSPHDIRTCLGYCHKPEEIQDWHDKKMNWLRTTPKCHDCAELKVLCSKVAIHLFHATKTAAQLQTWASGKHVSQDQRPWPLLNVALRHIYSALREFTVVAEKKVLNAMEIMEVVLIYLKMVYELKVILVVIAFRPEDASAFFSYWTECLDATGLEGFLFDDTEAMNRTRYWDRTLRGVIAAPDAMPESYLPSNPTFPIVFKNKGPYGVPIWRNSLFRE